MRISEIYQISRISTPHDVFFYQGSRNISNIR